MISGKRLEAIAIAVIVTISIFAGIMVGLASESSNTTNSLNTTNATVVEPAEEEEAVGEIEQLQQWIYEQGYNYTVAENWIMQLSLEERQRLCGYKPLKPPTEPLPENVAFLSLNEIPKSGMVDLGLHPVGQSPPSSYDAMSAGKVTPVRHQGACGSCWIFPAVADFESDVLINESQYSYLTLDFSEQEVGDCNIWSSVGGYDFCDGGNEFMTTNYFTKHGAADETCHPYAAASQICQNCPVLKNVDNWRIITGYDGNESYHINTIKNAILTYGPVYSTIYAGETFGAYKSGVYEYWGPEETNHVIEIIGWDDSLPHSHGTGAWLIKNSWGTGWGASGPYPGCAWVAYGAANLGDYTSAIASYRNPNPGDIIFYHDECGWMGYSGGCHKNTAYGAVRFTPTQSSTLTAVDFWAVAADITYEIKIFDTLNDLGGGSYTFSDQLGVTQTETTNEPGYYSIPLDTPVQLVSGNDFIVQVNFTTTGNGYPIPIDYYTAATWLPDWSEIATPSGESYVSCYGTQFGKPDVAGTYIDIGIRARAEVGTPVPPPSPPNITSFAHPSPVIDTVCNWRTFNVTVNQTVTVSWYLNGSLLFTNESVTEANCTLHAEVVGEHNVSAIGTNENGTDMQTWIWNVTAPSGLNCTCGDICVNTTGWWRNGGIFNTSSTPIQAAVNNASAGDTICVNDGTYNENVDVTKSLTIRSTSGNPADTIVNASNSSDHVFNVTADYVNISGFTVSGATETSSGMRLHHIKGCTIFDNLACNNAAGFSLVNASNNNLTNNNASSNTHHGIIVKEGSNNNNISGNTISNNGRFGGVYIWDSSSNNITGNMLLSNNETGITLRASNNNTISNNNASLNNETGIWLNQSSYNNLTDNTASKNGQFGIWLRKSPYNTLRGNVMDHNGLVSLAGAQSDAVEYWNNDIDPSNTVNGGSIYYFYGVNDMIIEGLDAKRVLVAGCNNVTVRNINYIDGDHITLIFTNNSLVENCIITNNNAAGFALVWSHYNRLINNNALNNRNGFHLQVSTHNNISSNIVTGNAEYGIKILYSSFDNLIYNNYFDNTNNAYDDGNNIWNITNTTGTNIIGGPYLGGNYWSDYEGEDLDEDGLGDTLLPYNSFGGIQSGGDYLPLVKPPVFDTSAGTYPSIMGTHKGTLIPSRNISVSKLYTYPCAGTGGHTEQVIIQNETGVVAEAHWNGYQGDWHNITFNETFVLYKNKTYNYIIITGSYPQIIHEPSKEVIGGTITCTEFVDANGKKYCNWIPAIKLY